MKAFVNAPMAMGSSIMTADSRPRRGSIAAFFVGATLLLTTLGLGGPTKAVSPGTNGLIAYIGSSSGAGTGTGEGSGCGDCKRHHVKRHRNAAGGIDSPFDVFVVNAANPFPTQVTNTGGYGEVAYNSATNKIVA